MNAHSNHSNNSNSKNIAPITPSVFLPVFQGEEVKVQTQHIVPLTKETTNETLKRSVTAFRIASLPHEFHMKEEVIRFLEVGICLGKVSHIIIRENNGNKNKENKENKKNTPSFKYALVEFEYLYKNQNYDAVFSSLLDAREGSNKTAYRETIPVARSFHLVLPDYPLHFYSAPYKTMTHLTISPIEEGDAGRVLSVEDYPRLEENISLYIPVLPPVLFIRPTKGDVEMLNIQEILEKKMVLGKIARVDRVEHVVGNGVVVDAGYVHFEYWCDNKSSRNFLQLLERDGQVRQSGIYDGENVNRFYTISVNMEDGEKREVERFFVMKKNDAPLPEVVDTTLNVHQLYATNLKLQEEMTKKDAMIEALLERIASLASLDAVNRDKKRLPSVERERYERALEEEEAYKNREGKEEVEENDLPPPLVRVGRVGKTYGSGMLLCKGDVVV